MRKSSIPLLLVCIVVIAAGCTSHPSYTTPVPTTASHPVASVKMTFINGVITSDVTNNMDSSESFFLVVDCYDGNIKVDTRIVDIPPLSAGETGRAKGYAPSGTKSIRLDSVGVYIGDKPYKVTYEMI